MVGWWEVTEGSTYLAERSKNHRETGFLKLQLMKGGTQQRGCALAAVVAVALESAREACVTRKCYVHTAEEMFQRAYA